MPAVSYKNLRLFLMLCCALLLASACGREALPRAARVTPTPQPTPARDGQPSSAASGVQIARPIDDARTLGDPKAPITVVEYGDYQ